jgi:hypothetical protein
MPIGSAKIGVLGAGLVPGGTVTFNATGTFTVPPGVKKVSITGRGGTGSPGNAGNAGNPGNIGYGAMGGQGASTTSIGNIGGGPAGSGGMSLRRHNPIVPYFNPGGSSGSQNTPNPTMVALDTCINPANTGTFTPAQPGYSGDSGSAGTAGNPGNPGTPGNASVGLNYNFAGGAGGNAGVGGNAGNGGSGGTGGGAGSGSGICAGVPCAGPTPNYPGGAGGNGAGSGGAGLGTRGYSPVGPTTPGFNWVKFGGSGGGGAGINDGSSGVSGATMPSSYQNTYINSPTVRTAGGTDPSNPFNGTISPTYFQITQNMTGGMGGAGIQVQRGLMSVIQYNNRQRPINNTGNPVNCYYPNPRLCYSHASRVCFSPTAAKTITANSVPINPLTNNMFRAGGGGGGGSYSCASFCTPYSVNQAAERMRSAGGGGGGGRGNAGNAGGNSTAPSGSAGTPATYNCVPVTPGSPYPITVGGPSGGQVVISWNPQ